MIPKQLQRLALPVAATAVAAALLTAVPATAGVAGSGGRGSVVSATPVLGLDPQQVTALLQSLDVAVPQASLGVDAYRVVYRTVDVRGSSTTASALVTLPRSDDRRLRPAVWLHGTQSYRADAPSVSECCDRAAGVLFASLGYASVAPDYLGLGEGPGTHPYLHSASMVSASVDALRAMRRFAAAGTAAGGARVVGGPVAVSGFSQGANGAMLLGRALQRGVDRDFPLGALAPISGAYELFDVEIPAIVGGAVEPALATYYLAYLTVAWNRIYHLYADESQVFQPRYAGRVAELFDGDHQSDEIMRALPARPADLLQPAFLQRLLHPTGRLAAAARANDDACLHWTPAVPVRMYAARTDPEAVFDNSARCQLALSAPDLTLTDVGDAEHITSLIRSIPQVAGWFATLR